MGVMLRAVAVVVASTVITLFSSISALAGQITVDFSGTVMTVDPSKISGTKAGDPFSGTLVYDSTTPLTSTPGADPAEYTALPKLASGLGLTLTVGGNTYTAELGDLIQITVGNDLMGMYPDVFAARAYVKVGGVATAGGSPGSWTRRERRFPRRRCRRAWI